MTCRQWNGIEDFNFCVLRGFLKMNTVGAHPSMFA